MYFSGFDDGAFDEPCGSGFSFDCEGISSAAHFRWRLIEMVSKRSDSNVIVLSLFDNGIK